MIRLTRVAILITLVTGLLIADLAVCGRVKFKKTWKNPEAQPTSWQGQKIAAFVITLERAVRLGAETTLARELTERGAVGIAGHTLVPLEVIRKDPEGARRVLESEGITGAVVMRVVSSDQEISYSPGSAHYVGGFYPTFWGYWGYGVGLPHLYVPTKKLGPVGFAPPPQGSDTPANYEGDTDCTSSSSAPTRSERRAPIKTIPGSGNRVERWR